MKYCPECEYEYKDEVQACADCEVPLISEDEFQHRKTQEEQERASLSREEFVPVKVAENAFEADRVKEALEQEGIPVLVRTFQDTAYDGIYVSQKGWGYVEVPESEKARAEQIVMEVSRMFPESLNGEEEDPEE
jgi:hypothetical protein